MLLHWGILDVDLSMASDCALSVVYLPNLSMVLGCATLEVDLLKVIYGSGLSYIRRNKLNYTNFVVSTHTLFWVNVCVCLCVCVYVCVCVCVCVCVWFCPVVEVTCANSSKVVWPSLPPSLSFRSSLLFPHLCKPFLPLHIFSFLSPSLSVPLIPIVLSDMRNLHT